MKSLTLVFLTMLMVFASQVQAGEPICTPLGGEVEGLEIGEIRILNQNIFNPENQQEASSVHRFANSFHIQTRASVISQQLLFEVGQPYSQRLVDESERKLRSRKYLHDASIKADMICDGKLVVSVNSSDNWTLTPSISIGRSGGINRTSIEISESNLLGLGKSISLKSESDEDRDSRFLNYEDDNLFGSRYRLAIKSADNSDGYFDSIQLGEPFFQLDSKHSLMLNSYRDRKQIARYASGRIVGVTGELSDGFSLEKGWSEGLENDSVVRYRLGLNLLDKDYFNVADYPGTALPIDSKRRYPYLAIEYLEDRYIQRENFNVMAVTEDIPIGNHFSMMAGLLTEGLGSSHDGLKLAANYSFGVDINTNSLAFIELGLSSEMNRDAADFNALSIGGNWSHYSDNHHSYFVKAEYQVADKLLTTDEYVVGGETGLRGYPIRYQTGNNRALLSVEKRNYFNWYPLKLMKFGVALFADVGSAWQKEEGPRFIKDVGIGIRLVSTRQSDAKVLHIDFSYPLDELDRVDGFQLVVKAKSRF